HVFDHGGQRGVDVIKSVLEGELDLPRVHGLSLLTKELTTDPRELQGGELVKALVLVPLVGDLGQLGQRSVELGAGGRQCFFGGHLLALRRGDHTCNRKLRLQPRQFTFPSGRRTPLNNERSSSISIFTEGAPTCRG